MESPIAFHIQGQTLWPVSLDQADLQRWLIAVAKSHSRPVDRIEYILADDEFILTLNKGFLEHDFYTDILTFPYAYDPIQAEIYLSVDRIADNAQQFQQGLEKEFIRVLAHGILHMCGLDDKESDQQLVMRKAEEDAIQLFYDSFNRL